MASLVKQPSLFPFPTSNSHKAAGTLADILLDIFFGFLLAYIFVFVKDVTIDDFILFYLNVGINDSIRIILLDSKDELIWLWQPVFY